MEEVEHGKTRRIQEALHGKTRRIQEALHGKTRRIQEACSAAGVLPNPDIQSLAVKDGIANPEVSQAGVVEDGGSGHQME
jgi:hypothetical protein